MRTLRVGNVDVDRAKAFDHAHHYLTDGSGWAYPAYDAYEAERAAGPLTDADLLAPVLLNVSRMKIRTYEALQTKRHELDGHLARIPHDLDLLHADTDDLAVLGDLFSVLDGTGVWGAQLTVLTKVLHRKRPSFVPLYDEQVRSVYQDGPDAPVPPQPGRSWRDFGVVFAAAVQRDLARELEFWEQISALATAPPITTLRALDIVAWWAGSPKPRRTRMSSAPATR
jgi:hypothetical protein